MHRRGWELHVVYAGSRGRHDRTHCLLAVQDERLVHHQQSRCDADLYTQRDAVGLQRQGSWPDAVTFRPAGDGPRLPPNSHHGPLIGRRIRVGKVR